MRKIRVVLGYATLAVALGLVTIWAITSRSDSVDPPQGAPSTTATQAATQAAAQEVTVVLHATGDPSTDVYYTCMEETAVSVCEATVIGGVWAEKVTVPVGTTVYVRASGGVVAPRCSITDESDRLVLVRGSGSCEVVAQ